MINRSLLIIFSLALFYSCDKTSEKKPDLKAQLAFKTDALLGEGAIWNHKDNTLFWVDIEGKKLHIYDPAKQTDRFLATESRVGTVVPYSNSEAVVALENGIYFIDLETGKTRLLSDVESDQPGNRFNDGKCDPNGNLWVGSMHYEQSRPEASLYRINKNGQTAKMKDNITISNGIVWTNDKSIMYYIDTPTGVIKAFDYNPDTSEISNERIAVEINPEDGFPDGMAIDENDHLWVGLWNGNAVAQYDPVSGDLIRKVMVPAHNVTACAFGGAKLDTLYITTSSLDMTKEEQQKYPDAGSIFKVVPGVKGVKSPFFGLK